jgi:3-oxoacyl-[acyl-carrier-protein] synthase III
VRIAAVAHRVPSRKVDNEELIGIVRERNAQRYDAAGQAVLRERLQAYFAQTGAQSRYWRAEGEKAVTLGLEAGSQALEDAGLRGREIDLLIFVGVGRGWVEPAMANLFLAKLGLVNATGFDILDACASWLRAVDLVSGLIRAGRCRRALVLNCECNVSEHCDFDIPDLDSLEYLLPGFTIGEAATATVLTDDAPEDNYHALFKTWGSYHHLCKIPLPNQEQYSVGTEPTGHAALKFYAYGTTLVRVSMRRVIATYHADPRFRALRPDICFGHSVSEAVTTDVERLLGLPEGTAYRILPEYGNTVSASLPLAMSLAERDGALRRGQTVLFVMGSAGISVGLATLTY